MKIIRKIIFKIILFCLLILSVYIAYFYIDRYFVNKSSDSINNYEAINDYEEKYPLKDYVSEAPEAIGVYKDVIIKSMLDYDDIADKNILSAIGILSKNLLFEKNDHLSSLSSLQYKENRLIKLEDVEDDETHNYQIIGYSEDNQEIRLNLALFGSYKYNITISFLDDNGDIDYKKASLLADDSNSERLAYLIVYETQKEQGTNMEPNEASKEFFGTNIERLAGDISYHAALAYILSFYGIDDKPLLYEKVKNVNIAVNDNDSVFMNRIY